MKDILIDPKNYKYKAVKMKNEELEKHKENGGSISLKCKHCDGKKEIIKHDHVSTMGTGTYSLTVKAVTDDPVGEDLAVTTHKLVWTSNGSIASYSSRNLSCWAANPSSFGTRWYTTACRYTDLRTIDGGRTLLSQSYSSYVNYDWGDDSKSTNVTHTIAIYGYYTGGNSYYVDWTANGEDAWLLDLDIVVQ